MCTRTCPQCGSTEHTIQYGLLGTTMYCDGCGLVLANRYDEEAAPTDCDDPKAYARARSGVRPGAEAADPEDDEMFQGTAKFSTLAA